MNRKNVTALCWAISSSTFLWLFSFVLPKSFSKSPTAIELFNSYVLFSFMLFAGGGCYHFLIEIISSEYAKHNAELWKNLMFKMIFMMLSIISAPIVILVVRDYLPMSFAWLVAFVYIIFSFSLATYFSSKIDVIFKQIKKST